MALTGMSPHEVDRIARQVAREEVEAYMQAQAKRCEEIDAELAKTQAEAEDAEVEDLAE